MRNVYSTFLETRNDSRPQRLEPTTLQTCSLAAPANPRFKSLPEPAFVRQADHALRIHPRKRSHAECEAPHNASKTRIFSPAHPCAQQVSKLAHPHRRRTTLESHETRSPSREPYYHKLRARHKESRPREGHTRLTEYHTPRALYINESASSTTWPLKSLLHATKDL